MLVSRARDVWNEFAEQADKRTLQHPRPKNIFGKRRSDAKTPRH